MTDLEPLTASEREELRRAHEDADCPAGLDYDGDDQTIIEQGSCAHHADVVVPNVGRALVTAFNMLPRLLADSADRERAEADIRAVLDAYQIEGDETVLDVARRLNAAAVREKERADRMRDQRDVNCEQLNRMIDHVKAERARAETAERELADTREAIRSLAPDCGDNSCRFAIHKGGMRTNGGCRCIEESGMPVEKRRRVVATIKSALASPDAGKGSP